MDLAITSPTENTLPEAKQSWSERLIAIFVAPAQTFRQIREENANYLDGLLGALVLVAFVFVLDGVRLASDRNVDSICWSIGFSLFLGMTYWLALAGLLAIACSCFGHKHQDLRASIVSLGWSFAPWMLTGPLSCYHNIFGSFFSLLSGIPYMWVFGLQYLALMESFGMKWWQAALLGLAVPILLSVLQITQIIQSIWTSMAAFGS